MLYILAVFFPPIAVFIATKSISKTLLNIVLTLLVAIPGIVHAFLMISNSEAK